MRPALPTRKAVRPTPATCASPSQRNDAAKLYQDETEGHRSTQRTYARATGRQRGRKNASGQTRADLYAEATRHDIRGRSKMSKVELERALHYR